MRYWKGAYDEDSSRDLELRRRAGLLTDELVPDDEKRYLGIFRALVTMQILMAVVALISLAELLASSR